MTIRRKIAKKKKMKERKKQTWWSYGGHTNSTLFLPVIQCVCTFFTDLILTGLRICRVGVRGEKPFVDMFLKRLRKLEALASSGRLSQRKALLEEKLHFR